MLLISLVPTVYPVKVVNTYTDFDFIIVAAAPGPVIPPPTSGGGGTKWMGPTEAMELDPVCGDEIVEAGETCENCPEDYEATYGVGFCKGPEYTAGLISEGIVEGLWPWIVIGVAMLGAFLFWRAEDDEKKKSKVVIVKGKAKSRPRSSFRRPRYRRYKWHKR